MDEGWGGQRGHRERGQSAGGITWLMGRMVRLPFAAFVYGVEIFARTMQEMQRFADQGLEVMVGVEAAQGEESRGEERPEDGRGDCGCGHGHGPAHPAHVDGVGDAPAADTTTAAPSTQGGVEGVSVRELRQEMREMDKDLRDDMLKLVRYKVLF